MDRIDINAVVFHDGDHWVAQCIEFDIAARADEPGKLPRAIERALVANLAMNRELGRLGLDGIEPAPPQFRELFERAPFDLSKRNGEIRSPEGVRIRDLRLAEAV
jgi:hypothetical protein